MKVAFYNNKGGTGKSTLCCHSAFRAIELGIELSVLDADRQGNTMSWLSNHSWNGEPYNVKSVRVTNDVEELRGDEFTLIDCPPSFEVVNSFPDVDAWIIPVDGRFSVDGCINVINEIKRNASSSRIVCVVNKAYNNKFGKAEMNEMTQLNVELFKFPIPSQDVVRKAEYLGLPAWRVPYGIRSSTALNLKLLGDWVINGCNKSGVYESKDNKSDFKIRR